MAGLRDGWACQREPDVEGPCGETADIGSICGGTSCTKARPGKGG